MSTKPKATRAYTLPVTRPVTTSWANFNNSSFIRSASLPKLPPTLRFFLVQFERLHGHNLQIRLDHRGFAVLVLNLALDVNALDVRVQGLDLLGVFFGDEPAPQLPGPGQFS